MRKSQGEHHHLAFHLGAVPDADDVELLLESIGDPGDGIGHERACQPVQRALFVALTHGHNLLILLLHLDAQRHGNGEFAFGPLHVDVPGGNLHLDALGERNRFSSNP